MDPEYIDKIVNAYQETNADLITCFDLPHGTFSYGIKLSALAKVIEIKDSNNTEVWGGYFSNTDLFDIYQLPVAHAHKKKIRLTLDYAEDYELLNKLYNDLLNQSDYFSLDEIIKHFNENPDLIKVNNHCDSLYQKRSSEQSKIKLKSRYTVQRAAIIGCGSIGKRHIKNLKSLGIDDIVALRTKKGATSQLPTDLNINEVSTWEALLKTNPDIAIISNPSSLHLNTLKQCMGKVKGIFIEKPISHSLDGIENVQNDMKHYKPVTFVGYNLRFHPVFENISKLVKDRSLGRPLCLQANVGQWLPDWHPKEDYKKLYVAQKKLGGGALLSLIHEVQMALDLFGSCKKINAYFPDTELLDIDTDTQSDLMLEHFCGAISQIHIDLLQKPMARNGVLIFQHGQIKYDFIENSVRVYNIQYPTGKTVWSDPDYDNNLAYLEMMRTFVNYVTEGRYRHEFDFDSGIESLKIASKARSTSSACLI